MIPREEFEQLFNQLADAAFVSGQVAAFQQLRDCDCSLYTAWRLAAAILQIRQDFSMFHRTCHG